MAGLILVGVTAVSAAALPTSKAGAVTPATTWTEQSPATSPSARYGASMAYDPATGDVVLFGGEGSSAFLDDTWTWDGSTWTERSPATSPSARYGASMAYDPATGNMVLFGGVNSSGFLNDTWTWNGITWTKQSPGTSPPARFVATMADDPATGNMVLFGGINGSTYLGDTWTWDGSTWKKQSPAASPPARDLASMAYDPAGADMVLFGGYSGSSVLDDTWIWSGTTWTKQSPATSPSARYAASMAYDPATGDMVLFGGNSTSVNLDDTWTWDGSTWTEQSPVASPSTRLFASMAYDPATGDMVLFGGAGAAGFGGDTWTYGTVQYAPTVSQTLSPSSPVLVGTPVTDTATLTGASPTAGGTVSYAVYSDPGCTDPVASLGSSVAVTDGVPGSSDPWTATAGNDWFETTYTGDSTDTGPVSSSCDPLTVDSPSIGLVKTASIASYSAPDTPVTYSYAVTNTGNAALSDVTVTDPMLGLTAVNCGGNSNVVASLGAGDSVTCTAGYTTSQTDVDAGSITNTGTAVGTPPVGPNVSANDSLTIPAVQNPAIGLTKSASVSGFAAAGTPITYSYAVANGGNVTLTSVSVTDPMVGLSAVICPSPTLAPGATETCTATYTTTQADVDAGSITNTGTATGTPPLSGPDVTATSTITVPAEQGPAIGIVKTASVKSYSAPGTVITYSYKVTDTGNVTLHPVTVTDPMKGLSAITCPSSALAPTASETCTATYTTTQADVDRGWIRNRGTATGTSPSGTKVTASASVVVRAVQRPKVAITKSASISSFSAPGTVVTYSYKVTDTGNVTLRRVTVVDPMFRLSRISCPGTTLSPGGTETCSATYTTTQADVDRGSIRNVGTVFALAPSWTWVAAASALVVPYTPASSRKKS